MGDVDAELRRYRVDFHSIAMGIPEPPSAYKLRMTYEGDFGDEVPFRKFGYMTFDAFLDDHPLLERLPIDGKTCYRAKPSVASAGIQTLVARQKKKKRNNGKKPAPFQRNMQQNRSFNVRPPTGAQQFSYNNSSQRSFRGGGATPSSGGLARSSYSSYNSTPRQPPHRQEYNGFGSSSGGFGASTGFGTSISSTNMGGFRTSNNSGFRTSSGGFRDSLGMARPSPPQLTPFTPPVPAAVTPAVTTQPMKPEDGKARILSALKQCQGKATLTKLNHCYQALFNSRMDSTEMERFFSTSNFKAIHKDWLSDEMDLNPDPSGQWVFMSKEIAKQQQDWAAAHKNIVADEIPRPVWDKPTLKELFDKVVAMLVNMYPEPLQVTQMSEVYKRAHGVIVDPVDLYCTPWNDLITGIFHDKMSLKPDGSVVLSDKAVRDHGLSATAAAPTTTHTTAIERVTAEDLGLAYSDDSDSEDEGESNSICSSTRTAIAFSSQKNYSSLPASSSVPPPSPVVLRPASEAGAVNASADRSPVSKIAYEVDKKPTPAAVPPPRDPFMAKSFDNSFASVFEMRDTLFAMLQKKEAEGKPRNGSVFFCGD